MSTKINVRSPYYVKISYADLDSVLLRLYVWEGSITSTVPITISLTKYAIGSNEYVVFDLSEYIRDYIVQEFSSYETRNVWFYYSALVYNSSGGLLVTVEGARLAAFDGYGYFEDGVNPELSNGALISNSIIYRLNDSNLRIPVFTKETNAVAFFYKGQVKRIKGINNSLLSDEQIEYVSVSGNKDETTYMQRVLSTGGTFELSPCLDEFLDGIDIGLVDSILVNYDQDGLTRTDVFDVVSLCENKYEPNKITFVNKFGALQDMWFFKKSMTTLSATSETYKANTMDFDSSPTYSLTNAQYNTFNKMGRENIRCSTGYLDEQYNEVIRQLMLSEYVWIDNGTGALPVSVVSNSLEFKKGVNDKLIDYTLEFQYAFDKINSVR
jgi:hypothetical protein